MAGVGCVGCVGCVAYPTAFKSNPTAFNDKSPILRGSREGIQSQTKPRILPNEKKYNYYLSTQQIYKKILYYLIV